MDAVNLARAQFGITTSFHYLFPPLSIGLGLIIVIMEGMWLKTKNPVYERMAHFWVKVFALIFGIGVATGIVLEFEFGTNWAEYSRFVGDIFGSALAAEGVFAFFLESGFLAVLVFGWHRVSPKIHFLSACMVALGSTFSAVWIIVANSFMQTPAGYVLVGTGDKQRAHIVNFWGMVFNPSSLDRLSHAVSAAWITGAFLVISVSAFYLVRGTHLAFAKASMKIGIVVALLGTGLQFVTGDASAKEVARYQPAKLAAMEGHFHSSHPLGLMPLGWVDMKNQKRIGPEIPGLGSWLMTHDASTPVTGLDHFKKEDLPNVQLVFQLYHAMVGVGVLLAAIMAYAIFSWWRGTLWSQKWFLKVLVGAVVLPEAGNQLGWMTAEFGRQPWIVYGLMRTSAGVSRSVPAGEIAASLALFMLMYVLLTILFFYLLNKRIVEGPDQMPSAAMDDKEMEAHAGLISA